MTPFDYWNSTKEWPLPTQEAVSLTHAMHALAKAQYGDKWVGREPWADTWPKRLPTTLAEATEEQKLIAVFLLRKFPEGPSSVRMMPLGAWERLQTSTEQKPEPADAVGLTEEEWATARELENVMAAMLDEGRARWIELVEGTFAFLKVGLLKTLLREVPGGPFEEAPDYLWNTELRFVQPRFGLGQVDVRRPFDQRAFSATAPQEERDFRLIFITTESLRDVIDRISASKTTGATELPELSLPKAKNSGGRTPAARAAAKECKAWLEAKMKASADTATATQRELWDEARVKWPELSNRQFLEEWRDLVENGEYMGWTNQVVWKATHG